MSVGFNVWFVTFPIQLTWTKVLKSRLHCEMKLLPVFDPTILHDVVAPSIMLPLHVCRILPAIGSIYFLLQ
jgi:hypothetical protein